MTTIINLPAHVIETGKHKPADVLIQISDDQMNWFPEPKQKFKETYQFMFTDAHEGEGIMTQTQAEDIMRILLNALNNKHNVIVHCVAGLCRSGAVVEVATMMGFEDPNTTRIPNVHVKTLLIRELQKQQDEKEKCQEL